MRQVMSVMESQWSGASIVVVSPGAQLHRKQGCIIDPRCIRSMSCESHSDHSKVDTRGLLCMQTLTTSACCKRPPWVQTCGTTGSLPLLPERPVRCSWRRSCQPKANLLDFHAHTRQLVCEALSNQTVSALLCTYRILAFAATS